MEVTLADVQKFIYNADMGDIKLINNAIKAKYDMKRSEAKQGMYIGKTMKFRHKGRWITGTITKINNKSIKLDCGISGQWSVGPTLLKEV